MFSNESEYTEVQQRIVDSARKLFIQNGFKRTTVRDIANDSGTNVAMVSYYFRSKDNLFGAIFGEVLDTLMRKIFSVKDSELPFFDLIREWIYSYYDTLMEYPSLPIFVLSELAHHPDMLQESAPLQQLGQLYAYLSKRVDQEEAKGTIRRVPISDFILNIISLSVFPFVAKPIVSQFLGFSDALYIEAMKKHREYVADFIIQAIRA
jgi:AcrR family transcriptional regulator